MAYRSLTNVFIMMRNNSVQNRQFYQDQHMTDRAALVEEGSIVRNGVNDIALPPIWSDHLEECHYTLRRLEEKIRHIDALHKESIHRPNFDDSSGKQVQIDTLTKEITSLFQLCHKLVENIRRQSNSGNSAEFQLAKNAMSSLVASIQNQYNQFKKTQNNYLQTLNLREERSQKYLNSALEQEIEILQVDTELENIDLAFSSGFDSSNSNRLTQMQLLHIEEDNAKYAEERDQQVKVIVRSIVDLNEIYKDLAHMVTEQGTILDHIDYNLEKSSVQIHQGLKQLQQADRYQQKSTKMKCILGLAITTFFMFILLVAVKFN